MGTDWKYKIRSPLTISVWLLILASGTVSRLYRHIRQAAIPARVASGIVDFCVTGSEPASVIWTLAGECSAFCVQRECMFMLRGRYVLWGGTQGTPTLVGVWSGRPGGLLTVRRCATQDCVIVYWEDVDDSCVKCIHVVCLWISVISLDPLGLSWINLLTLYYKRQQNVFSPFTLWRNLISRNRNVKKKYRQND